MLRSYQRGRRYIVKQALSPNVPMTRPQEALAIHEQQYGHTVTWVELDDGRVLMSGNGEFRVSDDCGLSWGEAFRATDSAGKTVAPEALVRLTGRTIGMAAVDAQGQLVFGRSDDHGRTWSAPVLVNPQGRVHMYQDTLLRTGGGRIILPVYLSLGQPGDFSWHREGAPFVGGYINGRWVSTDAHFNDPHFGASFVFYSDDDGQTWARSRNGELFILLGPGGPMEATYEPSVTEVSPGKLLMFMRANLGRYYQAWSYDCGETWTRPQPTQLAGTHAPAQIRTLPDTGHLLCVFTQQSEQEVRQGFIRTRLSSAVSRNGGGVWEFFQNVESIHEETHVEPGPIRNLQPEGGYPMREGAAFENDPQRVVPLPVGYGRWSYPSVLVLKDRVLMSHTYSWYDETAALQNPGGSRLKVLPISWFYGGQEPSENPTLQKLSAAPRP